MTEAGDRFGEGPEELADHVDELLRRGRNTLLELDDGRKVFAEIYGPAPRLLVIGAVDTAEALCAAAKQLGWRTIVADARGKFATKERIPSADELLVSWPQEAIDQAQPDYQTAVVVLTHDDKFDVPAIKGALGTEAFYIGALGSRRNQERRRERLLEAGVEEHQFERVSGPDGSGHRRGHARRNGSVDPGRDPRHARGPRRRLPPELEDANPCGRAARERGRAGPRLTYRRARETFVPKSTRFRHVASRTVNEPH